MRKRKPRKKHIKPKRKKDASPNPIRCVICGTWYTSGDFHYCFDLLPNYTLPRPEPFGYNCQFCGRWVMSNEMHVCITCGDGWALTNKPDARPEGWVSVPVDELFSGVE
jgi:hypothetical protein